jgi:hypothetical protein
MIDQDFFECRRERRAAYAEKINEYAAQYLHENLTQMGGRNLFAPPSPVPMVDVPQYAATSQGIKRRG